MDHTQLARVSKALAHPIRVAIVRILLDRDACQCGHLVDELPVAQATVSQHLKVLRDAGVVQGEIDGPRICYCVNRGTLRAHIEALTSLLGAEPKETTC